MAGRTQSRGICLYCGAEFTKQGASKHLAACAGRRAIIEKAESSKAAAEPLLHLRVRGAYFKEFWLDIEMRGSATLGDLDSYLRAIWLECCGHLSQFSFGGWRGDELSMGIKAASVFQTDAELTHLYDFGTTSETLIKPVGARTGKPTTKHPIVLMARNLPPTVECMTCGEPAKWFCSECQIEHDETGFLCDTHEAEHPHDDYGGTAPLVNSPRVGMCGYSGPANPPY